MEGNPHITSPSSHWQLTNSQVLTCELYDLWCRITECIQFLWQKILIGLNKLMFFIVVCWYRRCLNIENIFNFDCHDIYKTGKLMIPNIDNQEANTLDKHHSQNSSWTHISYSFSHGIYITQKNRMYLSSIQEILYKSPRQVSYSIGGLGYSPGQ